MAYLFSNESGGVFDDSDYVHVAGTAPTILNVAPNTAGDVTTATVDTVDTLYEFSYRGIPLGDITRATDFSVTGVMPLGGQAFGTVNNFEIVDYYGVSNSYAATFLPPSDSAYITLSADYNALPDNSVFKIDNAPWNTLTVGDQVAYQNVINGENLVFTSLGVLITQVPDNEYSMNCYTLDSSDSYTASEMDTIIFSVQNPVEYVDPLFDTPAYNNDPAEPVGSPLVFTPNILEIGFPPGSFSFYSGDTDGLSIDTNTGVITGSIATLGPKTISVQLDNSSTPSIGVINFDCVEFSLIIPDIIDPNTGQPAANRVWNVKRVINNSTGLDILTVPSTVTSDINGTVSIPGINDSGIDCYVILDTVGIGDDIYCNEYSVVSV